MKLRLLLISAIFVLLTGFLMAQTTDYIGGLNHSIATTDNFLSPLVNPAALGYGNAYGLGWMHLYQNDKWKDHYWLALNTQGISYIYEKDEVLKNGKMRDQSVHNLAMGSETFTAFKFPNLYTGLTYKWINNKIGEGYFKSGLLYRPFNSTSIGFTLDNPYKQSPAYQFGLGIRPLDFVCKKNAHRMEFSADFKYGKEAGDYTMFKPVLGVGTEIFNGVLLSGNYNLETETSMFSISLGNKKALAGSDYHIQEDFNYEISYAYTNLKEYKPILSRKSRQWYSVPVKSEVVTYKAPAFEIGPFQIFDNNQTSVETLINDIRQAKKDPSITGLLFMNRNFSASLALRQEIIAEIKDFKTTGKPVIFYYDGMSNSDYIFAAAVADKIYLNPKGGIDLKGISINAPYLKGTLNALGIDVYNFRSHPTKTAGNMLSETEMIPEERAMYESILSDLYEQMCAGIVMGRGSKLTKDIKTTIDEGPYYMAEDALRAGLVDSLIYEVELKKTLKQDFKFSRQTKSLPDYLDYSWAHPKKSKVAVIYAQGNIVMGKGPAGTMIAHQTTVDLIRKARKNPEYKGIILRIDSGGGSAQASDIIWKEIELAKKENRKPVVVTMAGVAGSGGYYIACNADHIVANPATITGSIGVLGITFTAERMFDKIRVNWDTVKKGRHSDFGSFTRQWTEDEKSIVSNLIDRSYHDFVSKVARSRNMEYSEVDSVAQGKIWTGIQGKNLGLVDELGGLKEATAKMKELTKIKHDVVLVNASKSDKMTFNIDMEPMMSIFPMSSALSAMSDYISLYDQWVKYKGEKVLYATPFNLDEVAQK